LAGSLPAAHVHGLPYAFSDVDLFCPTQQVLISTGRLLLDKGFTLDDRMSRVWARWLKIGMKSWHTNSLRLQSPHGQEFNLVFKLMDGHPTTSLAQVIESFDFGLLAMGYDLESDTYRDMRAYLYPHLKSNGPLPLMPNKRDNWRGGFISQYNGIREVGRYAKYHTYGYDMSAVKDDLVEGYAMAALYYCQHFKPEMQKLGQIFEDAMKNQSQRKKRDFVNGAIGAFVSGATVYGYRG
jgi:hypothetical protein